MEKGGDVLQDFSSTNLPSIFGHPFALNIPAFLIVAATGVLFFVLIGIIPEFERFTVQELLADGTPKEDLPTYEKADPASMSVAGLSRYWRKYHPEEVP